ncbi:hypothetical protein N9359_01500 [Luminiphilus sp.]|nr:hypothetical protein [Luminiphilus sp.]
MDIFKTATLAASLCVITATGYLAIGEFEKWQARAAIENAQQERFEARRAVEVVACVTTSFSEQSKYKAMEMQPNRVWRQQQARQREMLAEINDDPELFESYITETCDAQSVDFTDAKNMARYAINDNIKRLNSLIIANNSN